MPLFEGRCGGCHKALGRSHADCSLGIRNCAERPADPPRRTLVGLYLRACFCQGKIKRRCPILLKPLFRPAHVQITVGPLRVTRSQSLSLSKKRGEVSARRWPNSNPGRVGSGSQTRGWSGSPASPSTGANRSPWMCPSGAPDRFGAGTRISASKTSALPWAASRTVSGISGAGDSGSSTSWRVAGLPAGRDPAFAAQRMRAAG